MFLDRTDAARQLAVQLAPFRPRHPLVLAIPRGAVRMAKLIAQALEGQLDVVLVRKLGAPQQPELAIGSVDETGWLFLTDYAAQYGADTRYIETERRQQLKLIHQRRTLYTPFRPPISPAGRTVIVVDDGLASGATMIAALHALRAKSPAQLICAVPVAPADTLAKITAMADAVVCLCVPDSFQAVGQFYHDFSQVEDGEVIELLSQA